MNYPLIFKKMRYEEYLILKEIVESESTATTIIEKEFKKRKIEISRSTIRRKIYKLENDGLIYCISKSNPLIVGIDYKKKEMLNMLVTQLKAKFGVTMKINQVGV